MTSYDTLLVLARLILPVELLDCFDIVEIENDAEMLTIHLDEQNLPPLSPTVHSLESKGFLPAVYIRDFPAQAESTVHMLNWAIRSVKFLGVEFD